MTVIGGFLGAGKTTLVNHILHNTHGYRIAVLVNDFGAINIDAELIEAQEGNIIRLANGCICCGMGDDLSCALINMLSQEVRPEHLIIEASGVAEPWRIAEIAQAAPEFGAARIVVLADAAEIQKQVTDRYVGDLALSQIDCADLLILNKIDLPDDDALRAAGDWLAARQPGLRIVPSRHAMIDVSVLDLGISAIRRLSVAQVTAENAGQMFCSSGLVTKNRFDRGRLEVAMNRLPNGLLRMKGIIYFEGEPRPQILQASGGRWSLIPWLGDLPVSGQSRIIAIGLAAVYDQEEFYQTFGAAQTASS